MKNMFRQLSSFLILLVVLLITPVSSLAATPIPTIPPPEKCERMGVQGINTAVGCIPTENFTEFTQFFISWAIGIGGGMAFLLIVYAGFLILTSTGNPDRIKAGQELLSSALMGLVLIIFSLFILRVIGVDILGIPGFSK